MRTKSLILAILAVLLLPILAWGTDITTLVFYEKNKKLFGSTLNWTSDTIKLDLVSDTPDAAADDFYDDCTSATAGPVTLTTPAATFDAGTGEGTLTADNVTITATGTWRYFVVLKWDTDAAHSPLLYYGDAGTTKAAGTYILAPTSGVFIRIQ